MKKLALTTALLMGTAIPFNGFAKKEEEKVTFRNLTAETIRTLLYGVAAYYCYIPLHDYIKQQKDVDPARDEVFDTFFKGFWGVLIGVKTKTLFEKIELYLMQKAKPITDPVLDALKDVI